MASASANASFDWSKCIFCQKVSKSCKISCPAKSKRDDAGCGYKSLAEAVCSFQQHGGLPGCSYIQFWDEGDGIELTCKRHCAVWHGPCRAILHSTKLKRLQQRSADCTITEPDNPHAVLCDDVGSPAKLPRLTRAEASVHDTDDAIQLAKTTSARL